MFIGFFEIETYSDERLELIKWTSSYKLLKDIESCEALRIRGSISVYIIMTSLSCHFHIMKSLLNAETDPQSLSN